MRRHLVTTAIALVLNSGLAIATASAADLAPIYTKAPPPPIYSWTGFYTGVDLGYAWNDPTVTFIPNDPVSAFFLTGGVGGPMAPITFDDHGAFGGGDIGYNWQFNRSWLVGVETDFNVSSINGQGTTASLLEAGNADRKAVTGQIAADQEILWFGTVRARAGWLATNDLLLYGTGGFAYGKIAENVSAQTNSNFSASLGGFSAICVANTPCYVGSSDRISTGWTAGGGLEYRVPGTSASFKLEYLYVNLGAGDTVTAAAQNFVTGTTPSSFGAHYSDTWFNSVKLGVNWHF
jgi:outer membrane immunogenic protein